MYGAVTPVLINKWRPPTADKVWVGGKSLFKTNISGVPSLTSPAPSLLFFRAPFYFVKNPHKRSRTFLPSAPLLFITLHYLNAWNRL